MTETELRKNKVAEAIAYGLKAKASDWHWQAGQPLALTVYKEIVKCDGLDGRGAIQVTDADVMYLLEQYTGAQLRQNFLNLKQGAIDPSSMIGSHMFRFHFEMESNPRGESVIALTMRHIPDEIPVLDNLGLPIGFQNLIKTPPANGIVIVSGATGNGKTTTLAAAIDHINKNFNKKIVTIEAPVEFYHTPKRCVVQHRNVGVDLPNFKEGIEQVLRAKPDIIVVGEMRDVDTIAAALSAAETGHLVFGTLHSNNAPGVMLRILDAVPEAGRDQIRSQLSQSLRAIICQRLVPKIEGGLVGAYEFMISTTAIANQIRENKIGQIRGYIQGGMQDNMVTMNQSLLKLVTDKVILKSTALEFSDDRAAMQVMLSSR